MKVYHQVGHNYKWNRDCFGADSAGDGFILAPRSMTPTQMADLNEYIRNRSLLDPQFFSPRTRRGKLAEYDFFPDVVADGEFETGVYSAGQTEISAAKCVQFQIDHGFEYMVIPTRYLYGVDPEYIESQSKFSVMAFLQELRERKTDKPILLQLVMNHAMFKSRSYCQRLLNWVTGISDLAGVYLVIERQRPPKQVQDIDYLSSLLAFIDALRANDMVVVVGYLNSESVLLSLADPSIVTMGTYESTRIFTLKQFEEDDKRPMRSPKARVYLPALLQNIDHNYMSPVTSILGMDILEESNYRPQFFVPTGGWQFKDPVLYKHHLTVINRQLKTVAAYTGKERYEYVLHLIHEAQRKFAMLKKKGVEFDPESKGDHLPYWATVATMFAKQKGWVGDDGV